MQGTYTSPDVMNLPNANNDYKKATYAKNDDNSNSFKDLMNDAITSEKEPVQDKTDNADNTDNTDNTDKLDNTENSEDKNDQVLEDAQTDSELQMQQLQSQIALGVNPNVEAKVAVPTPAINTESLKATEKVAVILEGESTKVTEKSESAEESNNVSKDVKTTADNQTAKGEKTDNGIKQAGKDVVLEEAMRQKIQNPEEQQSKTQKPIEQEGGKATNGSNEKPTQSMTQQEGGKTINGGNEKPTNAQSSMQQESGKGTKDGNEKPANAQSLMQKESGKATETAKPTIQANTKQSTSNDMNSENEEVKQNELPTTPKTEKLDSAKVNIKVAEPYTANTESKTFTKQIADKIIFSANEGSKEIEIQLTPKDLGKITIKLVFEGNTALVQMTASNAKAQSILNLHADGIRHIVETNTHTNVVVSVNDESKLNHQRDFNDGRGEKQSKEPEEENKNEAMDEDSQVAFVNQLRLGLLNRNVS